jgi:hypothetical protein
MSGVKGLGGHVRGDIAKCRGMSEVKGLGGEEEGTVRGISVRWGGTVRGRGER